MKIIMSREGYGVWPKGKRITYPHIFLTTDNWNDYGFETKFSAAVELSRDKTIALGPVKIGHFGHSKNKNMRDILLPEQDRLDGDFFSLGQDISFYERLRTLSPKLRSDYAETMRDIPMLGLPISQLNDEPVFEISLLRTSSAREALDKAPTLFNANAEERPIDVFEFETTLDGANAPHRITFDFAPDNDLPHRINVLVGVNSVGKTQLMAHLAMVLSQFERVDKSKKRTKDNGTLKDVGTLRPTPTFYSVLAISFSAFDDFQLPSIEETEQFRYAYCGLRNRNNTISSEAKLANRIPDLIKRMTDKQRELTVEALSQSLGKPVILEKLESISFYSRLSSGQRIVANIIADLALNLRPRSLVLFDEPETHLHPQLVSRLLSVLNDLLKGFDSAAIIATHTPIVVQQVLSRRVHIIKRTEETPVVSHPLIETFGENLSEIVRVVFNAVESDRGYQEVIDALLRSNDGSISAVEEAFGGKLGFNASTYLRSWGTKP